MPSSDQPAGVIDIVAAAWKALTENVKLFLEFAVWSTALGVFLWLLILIVRSAVSDLAYVQIITALISIPFSLAFSVITLALIDAVWNALNRKPVSFQASLLIGLHRLLRFIWLSLLTGVVFLIAPAAVFGFGFLGVTALGPFLTQNFAVYAIVVAILTALAAAALLIPIYFALPISFTANLLMIEKIGGWKCIKQCANLVRGRWWRALWRLGVPALFFWLASQFVLKIAYLLFGSLLGDPGLFYIAEDVSTVPSMLRSGFGLITAEMVYGLAAPLFVAANLIVWHDLRRQPQ